LAEWPATVTHWQLIDASDGTTRWDRGMLADPYLEVTGAGAGPSITLAIFYADSLEDFA
jgi:hypothetical protein